jgi:hypothetical protein
MPRTWADDARGPHRTACYESPSTKYPEFFRAIFAAFDFGR